MLGEFQDAEVQASVVGDFADGLLSSESAGGASIVAMDEPARRLPEPVAEDPAQRTRTGLPSE